jgi:hypothetical protein
MATVHICIAHVGEGPLEESHRLARQALSACLAVALLLTPAAQSRAPARLVAIADVHGAYPQLVALLQR